MRVPMKISNAAVWAGVAALGLGLTACGESGDGGAAGSAGTGNSSAPTSTATAESSVVSGGLTPPGTQLKLGRPAIVGWVPPSLSLGGSKKSYKLQVTVAAIQKGTIADFKNVRLKPGERKSTPYYVTVRIKALGADATPSDDDPDITFDAIDDRDQKQGSITFLGTFSRCDNVRPPKPFVKGKSYTSCLAYLMPGGGSIQQVNWANGPAKGDSVTPYFDKPIVWSGG
jgi:hypothetical protein